MQVAIQESGIDSGCFKVPLQLGIELELTPFQPAIITVKKGQQDYMTFHGIICIGLETNDKIIINPLIVSYPYEISEIEKRYKIILEEQNYSFQIQMCSENVQNAQKINISNIDNKDIDPDVLKLRLQQTIIPQKCAYYLYTCSFCVIEVQGVESTPEKVYRITRKTKINFVDQQQEVQEDLEQVGGEKAKNNEESVTIDEPHKKKSKRKKKIK